MPYRSFRDAEGTEWEAWDVVPRREERRGSERRADSAGAERGFDRRRGMERRLLGSRHSAELDAGWLCFQAGTVKRRLAPIPADWSRCDDARLLAYRDEAHLVRRASGRPNPAPSRAPSHLGPADTLPPLPPARRSSSPVSPSPESSEPRASPA